MSDTAEFLLDRKFAETAHALLYHGRRRSDDLPVVIKLVPADHPTATDLERLRQEYTLLSTLEIPGIVRALALAQTEVGTGLVLERVRGRSLADLIAAGQPSLEMFLRLAIELAKRVESIHLEGILHKDIKPGHFLLDDETGAITLIDFGIATRTLRARADCLEGTLAYISPEQTGRTNRVVDRRTDLYSLGVTYYELLSGRLPFEGQDPLDLIHSHVARKPAELTELVPSLPPVIAALVSMLLAKAPDDRYQTASSLVADLELCLAKLRATGTLEAFPLAQGDVGDALRLSGRLYGRDRERQILAGGAHRARNGGVEAILLTGSSGVGKSALVEVLYREECARSRFVTGKFDQLNRGVPYSAIVQVCRSLVRPLLAATATELSSWARRLTSALEPNAGVMIDLVPELQLLIGVQPAPLSVGPTEALARMERVVQTFLQMFAAPQSPLVLFLDDLQWADAASIRLLEVVLTAPDAGHLLFLGSYRDKEVDAHHPLTGLLERLAERGMALQTLALEPLTHLDVRSMVADALSTDSERVMDLAALVAHKTDGTPFFVQQFLANLVREGLLSFNARLRAWTWNLERIERAQATDNVVELLATHLLRLPLEAQEVLHRAACIGRPFDLEELTTVTGRSVPEVEACLQTAMHEGFLVPYEAQSHRFQHDRIQQAAYALVPPDDCAKVHLQIGCLLLARWPGEPPDDALFDILAQMNRGLHLVCDLEERRALAALNLRAGLRACDSAAFGIAAVLLSHCIDLLGATAWDTDYALLWPAQIGAVECHAALGQIDAAFAGIDALEQHGGSSLDRVAALRLKMGVLTQVNRMADAVDAGVAAASLLGVDLPQDAAVLGPAVGATFGALQGALAARPIESLVDLPQMTDPAALAAAAILGGLLPCAYQSDQNLMALVIFKAVALSLERGNPPQAPHFYASYALLFGAFTGNHEVAYRYGKVGVALADRPFHRRSAGAGEFVFSAFVAHWWSHASESIAHFRRCMTASLEVGDTLHYDYAAAHVSMMRLFVDGGLTEIERDIRTFAEIARLADDRTNIHVFRLVIQLIANVQGRTVSRTSFDAPHFSEDSFIQEVRANPSVMGFYFILKTLALYLTGDFCGALASAEGATVLQEYQRGMPLLPELFFLRALARAGAARQAPPEARGGLLEALETDFQALRDLAGPSSINHGHEVALVAAEYAALTGAAGEALEQYDLAMSLAKKHGFVLHDGLANELCGRFHLERRRRKVAGIYLLDALNAYQRWGADTKCRDMMALYPEALQVSVTSATQIGAPMGGSTSFLPDGLDMVAAVRMTQAIASERVLSRLMERLMRSLVENAGAQRGFLIVSRTERLLVSAAFSIDPENVRMQMDQDLEQCSELCSAVVRFVARSREPVVIADAILDPTFGDDAYIVRERPRSILCVPMVNQGRLTGVMYLTSNADVGVFDPARACFLQILAAQAATALENAALNEELERRVADRTAALATANGKLQASLRDLENAQRRLLDLSRQAGMAEVATSILHNVGNVLNSINVSTSVVASIVSGSKATSLHRLVDLLEEHRGDLETFLTEDARGRRVPDFLAGLDRALHGERAQVLEELSSLQKNLEHVNAIVSIQQSHAKGSNLIEELSIQEVLEDAMQANQGVFDAWGIVLQRDIDDVPPFRMDRHKVLQILLNLLSNAGHAVMGEAQRLIVLRCRRVGGGVAISVEDNGVGIPAENLKSVFNYGFTTKADGHGFGLHSSANAAKEMGGALACSSEGPGKGAVFNLMLPFQQNSNRHIGRDSS